MNSKVSKTNILLIAISLLLIFVAGFTMFGKTNSWLIDSDQISFEVTVNDISISVKQGTRLIENDDQGLIYLGSEFVEAGVACDFEDVMVVNNEMSKGYYLRCQVFMRVADKVYNINNCIENDLYKSSDGWMYYAELDEENNPTATAKQMDKKDLTDASKGVVTIMKSLTLPKLLEDYADDSNDVYLSDYQGQVITLHLFIEGSALEYTLQT